MLLIYIFILADFAFEGAVSVNKIANRQNDCNCPPFDCHAESVSGIGRIVNGNISIQRIGGRQ